MRRTAKKTKTRKINKMTKAALIEFIKELEKNNQTNSKVYEAATSHLAFV